MTFSYPTQALVEIQLPSQFSNIISFAILTVLAACSVTAMIKIANGFKQWIRGEDAFAEIKSGFLIAGVPWAVQAAFNGVGIYQKLGIPMVPTSIHLPDEMASLLQYGLWIVIALFLALAMYLEIEGAQKTSRGEDGIRMIWGAFGIAGAPWLMIGAFKIAGFWDAFGFNLT